MKKIYYYIKIVKKQIISQKGRGAGQKAEERELLEITVQAVEKHRVLSFSQKSQMV
jgi:hypothetical protein